MTLAEVAYRIQVHLRHMAADPKLNAVDSYGQRPFHFPYASKKGSRIEVSYVSYHVSFKLSKDDAETYLAWLDAGNRGCHYERKS